jgi:MATE family multidrug resistance protein
MATPIAPTTPPLADRSEAGGVREVALLAYPIVLTQISHTVMHVVDSIFVGRLGPAQLGALGFAGIWVWTVYCVFNGALNGVQTFVSQAHGAEDNRSCGRWAWQALWGVVPATAVAMFGFAFAVPALLALLRPAPEIVQPVIDYVHTRPLGMIGLSVWIALAAFFRGIGDTRTPLVAALVAEAVNAVLAYGLVLGHFGLPALGIVGAGVATSIAEWVGAGVLLAAFLLPSTRRIYGTSPVGPDFAAIRRFLRTGAPIGGQWLLDMSSFALFTTLVARMGTASIAANQSMISLLSMSFMQAYGIGLAATTLVGRYKGAEDLESAARSYRSARKLAVSLAFAVAALFVLAPEPLIRMYTSDGEVLALARPLLALGAAFQLFDALQIVVAGALRGAGDTRWPFAVSTGAAWVIRLPLAWLFAVTLGGGVVGAWYAEFVFILSLAALLMWRFRSGAWRRIAI